MKKLLVIKGDTNDADYVEQRTIVNEDDIAFVRRIAGIIEGNDDYPNWGTGWEFLRKEELAKNMYAEVISEEEYERFSLFVPYGEMGIHSIDEITLYTIADEERIL